jgi:hypothetical protein
VEFPAFPPLVLRCSSGRSRVASREYRDVFNVPGRANTAFCFTNTSGLKIGRRKRRYTCEEGKRLPEPKPTAADD